MTIKRDKTRMVSSAQQMLAGAKLHLADGTQTIPLPSGPRTVTSVTALLQTTADLRQAVVTAQATTKARLAEEEAQIPANVANIREFTRYLRLAYGNQPQVLADFGLAPPKARTPPTAEQKAVAVVKGQATRKARHTMGKNQKKAVKGDVNASLVITPGAGSTPTAPAPAEPVTATPSGGVVTTPHA
ncbi:MAG TPA: hypothetical protein VHV30_03940 [Polyangiaceae bacterium]|nr:hypothetical protein [Polyangiaceae bacterium]